MLGTIRSSELATQECLVSSSFRQERNYGAKCLQQLGNARTTTGTEDLTVQDIQYFERLEETFVGFSIAFERNNVLFIDFIGDLTLRASSNEGATDTSSLNPRLMGS